MLGKAKLPGELINWLTMTLLRALCLTECLKGTVLWNVQHIRLEKKAVRGQRTAGGKEIHDSAGFSSSYRVEWATAQTPSTHAPQRRRLNSHSCMLEARFQKLYSLWKVYHRVCTIKSHLLKMLQCMHSPIQLHCESSKQRRCSLSAHIKMKEKVLLGEITTVSHKKRMSLRCFWEFASLV